MHIDAGFVAAFDNNNPDAGTSAVGIEDRDTTDPNATWGMASFRRKRTHNPKSARKPTQDRPFICPILDHAACWNADQVRFIHKSLDKVQDWPEIVDQLDVMPHH